jgi:hypothetical protein
MQYPALSGTMRGLSASGGRKGKRWIKRIYTNKKASQKKF